MSKKLLILTILIAVLIAIAAGVILGMRYVAQRRRMAEVRVVLAIESNTADVLEPLLSRVFADANLSSDGKDVDVVFSSTGSDEIIENDRDLEILGGVENADRASIFIYDPYVLAVDVSAGGSSVVTPGTSIKTLISSIESFDRTRWIPFVLAGDERPIFSAFIMYLAAEMLAESELKRLSDHLFGDESSDSDTVEEILTLLSPIVDILNDWRDRGILVQNWTDWDNIAVRTALLDRSAVVTFLPRSTIKDLEWEDRLNFELIRPPSGETKRDYRMVGEGIRLVRSSGARAEMYSAVFDLLRADAFQNLIESNTRLSPMYLSDAPVNREHQEVVRWLDGAEDLLTLSPDTANNQLFSRLHILLR